MGISGSRGKKVAPASMTEGDPSAQILECQTSSVSVPQKNIQKDRLSNRRVAQFSADDRNLGEEVDRILKACENTEDTKRGFWESPLYVCENYAFCYNQRDQRHTDAESTHTADILLSDLLTPGGFEDRKDICTFSKLNKPQKQTAVTADPVCTKTTHIPGICDDISLALPVSYDASEEDLMSAIEREFG
ncbi:hypothetical protein PHYPO_G00017820 [Pangasianodon hypophthalmus]|uniref:Uncharacterized protein n=1 Tax=Pangasianodon hypophthalmus TaxID=310915 RepID=A0A5N5N6N2_PANHP|nr:hypothetical protein PHYPO_G00017820 [Pangasianodon hypophthalmus]